MMNTDARRRMADKSDIDASRPLGRRKPVPVVSRKEEEMRDACKRGLGKYSRY